MTLQKVQLRAFCEKAENGGLRIVATDETFDRSGESVPFESWDLTNYQKSPRLLIDHDYSVKSIVGKGLNVEKDEKRRAITFEPLFHAITQAAKETREMVEQGFLDTVSVGFLRNSDEKGAETNELMEISFVAVPANPNARTLSVKDVEPDEEKAINEFLEKAVVPKHDPPTMDEGMEWDAGAAEGRLRAWAGGDEDTDWGKYKEGFAWYDSANAETFGAYKLPHHDVVDGTLKTNWRGVAAAMGAIMGARGGVDIPESEVAAVKAHLAGHYAQFDKPVPEKQKEPMEGDPCTMDDGTEGTMQMGDDGQLMCMMKKAPEPDVKSGRVLSEKNRNIIKTARESMQSGVVALDDLLAATELSEGTEGKGQPEPENNKGRMPCEHGQDDGFEKFVMLRKATRAAIAGLNEGLRNARSRKD